MPFKIVRNDITKMQVDAVVNTANEEPIYSTGVDTAIYLAAGTEELLAERRKIGRLEEGEVAITPGFKLPAKYIIHAVSPCYIDGESGEEDKLRDCYQKSLQLARENHCQTIAFPLIATGGFGYPKEEGMRIAVDEINTFLLHHEMTIYLVVFDTKATELALRLQPALEAYIDHHYVCDKREEEYGDRYFGSVSSNAPDYSGYRMRREEVEARTRRMEPVPIKESPKKSDFNIWKTDEAICESADLMSESDECPDESDDWDAEDDPFFDKAISERVKHMSDTFQEYLLYLIESKGMTNAEVYKRAIITKQTFSKIKNNPKYHPDKATVIRLCVGARLSLDESKDLLARAGYALSPCDMQDVIFSFYIENKHYNMIDIDIKLEEYGLPHFIE